MVTTTPLLALLTALPFLVSAASPHGASDNGPAVVDYLPRTPPHLHPDARRSRIRRAKKQCRPKSIPKKSNHSSGAEGGAAPASSTVAGPSASTPPTSEPVPSPQAGSPPNTSSPPSDAKPGSNPPQADAAGGSGGRSGLLQASGPCGDANADANNPNGQEAWLNCGIDAGGWNPPNLTIDQIKYVDLSADGVFAPCAQYFDKLNSIGASNNLPPIMLAAIAMQESTCNPQTTGGAGESGMMQLGSENCQGAPGGNCLDLDFNINKGAQYLRQQIDNNGGNVLLGLGAYNGWSKGMTTGTVENMKNQYGCASQQNLDYMTQFLNGWIQGKNGYDLGTYKNRASCT